MIYPHNGLVAIQLLAMMASNASCVRKFPRIMRYLHVYNTNKQVLREHTEYDKNVKVREFQKNIENEFNHLFVPAHFLTPKESLLRAFLWMIFKARIIT